MMEKCTRCNKDILTESDDYVITCEPTGKRIVCPDCYYYNNKEKFLLVFYEVVSGEVETGQKTILIIDKTDNDYIKERINSLFRALYGNEVSRDSDGTVSAFDKGIYMIKVTGWKIFTDEKELSKYLIMDSLSPVIK